MNAGADAVAHEFPVVRAVAQRAVRLVNEVVAGARPPRQVTSLFCLHLRGVLYRARPAPGGVARLRHLAITSHRRDVYEVVAVCAQAGRITAVGLQLTHTGDGSWQITDIAHPQLAAVTGGILSDPPSGRSVA